MSESSDDNQPAEAMPSSLNAPITEEEIRSILEKSGSTSPGPDDISNDMLKNLPQQGFEYIVDIFNFIWQKGVFPEIWKEAIVIPVQKPGKDNSKAINYRPISLTCNLCKVLEKIVSNRLRWKLEREQLLSANQFGFRENRFTLDHLVIIEAQASEAIIQGGHLLVVSMDMEKAYEMIWKERVIELLGKINIEGHMLDFIKNFLDERFLKVRINNNNSTKMKMENGLPQGSVLSVILFLIAINDIMECIDSPVQPALFADDLTLTCFGKNAEMTIKVMQRSMDKLEIWTNKTGFKFSESKSEYMFISRKKIPDHPNLLLGNHPLKQKEQLKILGMILDKKLTWVPHITKLKTECLNRINIIKALSSTRHGATKTCLIKIYKTIIQSTLDYGSVLYDGANKNILKSIESVLNSASRLCLGAFRTSPIPSLLVEMGEVSLRDRRKFLCMKYASSISAVPQNPAFAKIKNYNQNTNYRKRETHTNH